MRIGLVVNPTAGRRRAARFHAEVAWALTGHGHEVEDLTADDAASALAGARAALPRLEALVVAGGDGVVHLGANVVAGTDVPLGIVPVGSGNDVATGLALPRKPRAAVALIARELAAARSTPTDAMRVTHAGGEAWAMGTLSCGLDAAVNARANRMPWPRGSLRYPLALIGTLPRFGACTYRVAAGDWVWEGRSLLVAASNIGYFGGGMNLAPTATADDGLLEVVTVDEIGKGELLWVFPRIYAGTHVHHPKLDVRRAHRVRIEADAPREGFADGERMGALPMTVEAVRGAVRLLRPPPAPGARTPDDH